MSDIPLEPGLQDTGDLPVCPEYERDPATGFPKQGFHDEPDTFHMYQRLFWLGSKFTSLEANVDPTGRKLGVNQQADYAKYPFSSPSREYLAIRGADAFDEGAPPAKLNDILKAILLSADCLFFELRKIREAASIAFAGRDQ